MFHCRYLLFYFIFLFIMVDSNQHCLGIFIIFTLGVFIVIIFIMRCFINYPQEKIIILRGVIDELD